MIWQWLKKKNRLILMLLAWVSGLLIALPASVPEINVSELGVSAKQSHTQLSQQQI